MDEIIADVDDSDFLLPASVPIEASKGCKECTINSCSIARNECHKNDACNDLLECKSIYNNPYKLAECDDVTKDKSAHDKYRSYFECVFLTNCKNKCNGGTYLKCSETFDLPEDDPEKFIEQDDDPKEIKLTVQINQLKDMWADTKMVSPGEHNVSVQWAPVSYSSETSVVKGTEVQIPICDSLTDIKTEKHKGITEGLGKVVLSIPSNTEGFLKIQRGNPDPSSFEALGPFYYYLGRKFVKNEAITLYLPSKAFETDRACDYFTCSNEAYLEGSYSGTRATIMVVVYDCLGTPASGISLNLYDIDNKLLTDEDGWYIGYPSLLEASKPMVLYWDEEKTTELGIGNFFYNPRTDDENSNATKDASVETGDDASVETGDDASVESKHFSNSPIRVEASVEELLKPKHFCIVENATTVIVIYPQHITNQN